MIAYHNHALETNLERYLFTFAYLPFRMTDPPRLRVRGCGVLWLVAWMPIMYLSVGVLLVVMFGRACWR